MPLFPIDTMQTVWEKPIEVLDSNKFHDCSYGIWMVTMRKDH